MEKNRVHTIKDMITVLESVSGVVSDNQVFSNIDHPIATGPNAKVKIVGNHVITSDR